MIHIAVTGAVAVFAEHYNIAAPFGNFAMPQCTQPAQFNAALLNCVFS